MRPELTHVRGHGGGYGRGVASTEHEPTASGPTDTARGHEPTASDPRDTVVAELVAALPAGSAGPDRASTVRPGRPLAVVRAASTAEVQATVRVASTHRVPIVTRGAGTGLSGGAAAVDGCITLSTERMRAITVDPAAMVAVVQPGLL